MCIEKIKNIISEWAKNEPLVTKAYIFGSRARNDYLEDSDLDVAVEIRIAPNDENVLTTWMFEHEEMEERLAKLLPYELQLENLDGEDTPTVLAGVRESSILVYEDSDQ